MLLHIIYNKVQQDGVPVFEPLEGRLRVIGAGADGWCRNVEMDIKDLPEEKKAVYLAVAEGLKSQGESWVARQVWAHLTTVMPEATTEEETDAEAEPTEEPEPIDAVSLTVEAVQDGTDAVRTFSPEDDPNLLTTVPAVVAFFKSFMS